MSPVAIILIIGSIFVSVLTQALARQVVVSGEVKAEEFLLALGLLYCATRIYLCWLGSPRRKPVEGEEDDQQNEK